MPLVLYAIASLAVVAPFLRGREFLREPASWAAFFLIYGGPLAMLASKTIGAPPNVSVFISALGGLACLLAIVGSYAGHGGATTTATNVRILLLLLVVGLALGSVTAGTSVTSLYRDAPTYFVLVLVGFIIGSSQTVEHFVSGAFLAIVATCAGSLVMYWAAPDLVTTNFSSLKLSWLHAGRLVGPFGHPNALGTLAALGVALGLSLVKTRARYLVLFVCGTAVLLTDQRSALLAVILCTGIDALWPGKTNAFTWMRTSLVVLAAAALVAINVVQSAVYEILNRREASVESRQQVYDYTFAQLDVILPLGIGVNGLYDRTAGIISAEGFAHAHNAWLTFLVAGGVLAGLSFLGLTMTSALRCFGGAPRDVSIPLVCVLALSLVESPVFPGSNWTIVSVATLSLVLVCRPLLRTSPLRRGVYPVAPAKTRMGEPWCR